jgi:hypothetical protein
MFMCDSRVLNTRHWNCCVEVPNLDLQQNSIFSTCLALHINILYFHKHLTPLHQLQSYPQKYSREIRCGGLTKNPERNSRYGFAFLATHS